MKRLLVFILLLAEVFLCVAQDSTHTKKWTISGFADLYYQYDFNQPATKERPPFVYNHKRNNRASVNLALLKVTYDNAKLKANIALMAGDYAKYNLASEPRWLQYVYEANLGYRFTNKLSVEAGVLPSHIGFESAVSKDCWNLSRSLLAENSPYFETGVKVNYTVNKKWMASALLLQGWQNIKDNNRSKVFGTQVVFTPNEKWLFNSSTFLGNEQPDSIAAVVRMFHNLYITRVLTSKTNIALLFDAGVQGKQRWWGGAAMVQFKLTNQLTTALRAEYYADKNGIIVSAYKPLPFSASGFSVNIDFLPANFLALRSELKYYSSENALFFRQSTRTPDNFSLLFSASVKL